MIFFTIGYLVVIVLELTLEQSILDLIVGFIFFFGSLFVFLTVYVGKKTIIDLIETTVSKSFVENIIKSMADTLIVINIDKNATIKTVNNATLNLLGFGSEDLIGQPVTKVLSEEIVSIANLKNLKELESIVDIETRYKTKSGSEVPVSFSASVLKNSFGELEGVIFVGKDIRERKEAEAKINEYIAKLKQSELSLKELNASKDKFFSIIAHDLRNPFSAVLGFSEILSNDVKQLSKEEIEEFASHLYKQSKTIFDLLENLLTWSRVQTGRMQYNPANFSISQCIENVADVYESVAQKKGIVIEYCKDEEIVFADEDMIFTVIRNLVSNAIKFTKPGGKICVELKKQNDFIELIVADTGIGVSGNDIEKLFKIDIQHSTIGTGDEKGTGLGLILCKELVTLNGGKISVESKLGQGTKFFFTVQRSKNI